jgi:hypothetical protein
VNKCMAPLPSASPHLQVQQIRGEEADKPEADPFQELDESLAEMWSQGAEGSGFSAEEIKEFRKTSAETDPRLFFWLINESLWMQLEHLGAVKKKSTPPAGS